MKISVIGLGYVGLPLAALLARGHDVTGYEKDEGKVKMINAGISPIDEPGLSTILKQSLTSLKFRATSDECEISDSDVKIITVGTPYDAAGDTIDYSQLHSSLEIILRNLKRGDTIILKSTVPPGTTSSVVKRAVEDAGFIVPDDIGLVFSPERMVEGQAVNDFLTLPKIIGATDDRSYGVALEVISTLGGRIIRVSSPETAEMVKMVDNYTRFVLLGLTNEIALMSEKVGVDVMELIASAKAEYPRNSGLLVPGPGVGGSCLNKDPFILRAFLSQKNLGLRMIESAREVNYSMPHHVADLVKSFSNGKRKVVIAGVAFKGDTDDTRFTPAFDIGSDLENAGYEVKYSDPFVRSQNTPISADIYRASEGSDIIVLLADHSAYRNINLDLLRKSMGADPLIIDTRSAIGREEATGKGFEYHGLGRL